MTDPTNTSDAKFLARFAVYVVTLTFLYLAAVTFLPLGSSGIKYADIAVPLLLGTVIGGLMGFWYGASKGHPSATAPVPTGLAIRALGTVPSGTPGDPVAVHETKGTP